MSVIDLHPEELLDKEARGDLNAADRTRLESHLARCAACRFERNVRADFRVERSSQEATWLTGLVEGALAQSREPEVVVAPAPMPEPELAPAPEPRLDAPRAPVVRTRRAVRHARSTLLVAAALLVATAATAAVSPTTRAWIRKGAVQIFASQSDEVADARTAPPKGATRTASGAKPSRTDATARVVDEAISPLDTPANAITPTPSALAATDVAVAQDPLASPIARVAPPPASVASHAARTAPPARVAPAEAALLVAPPVAPAPAPVARDSAAAEILADASRARRRGDDALALTRYAELATRFPSSREASSSHAFAGRLLLDRGDAAGALSHFDVYLRSGRSELREETMAGRATALGKLGRSLDETSAWHALLGAYPETAYGAHARARLGRSGAP